MEVQAVEFDNSCQEENSWKIKSVQLLPSCLWRLPVGTYQTWQYLVLKAADRQQVQVRWLLRTELKLDNYLLQGLNVTDHSWDILCCVKCLTRNLVFAISKRLEIEFPLRLVEGRSAVKRKGVTRLQMDHAVLVHLLSDLKWGFGGCQEILRCLEGSSAGSKIFSTTVGLPAGQIVSRWKVPSTWKHQQY